MGSVGIAALMAIGLPGAVQAAEPAAAGQSRAALTFDIPAQDLKAALPAFAGKADLQLIYEPQLAEGRKAAGLSGTHTTEEALKLLLAGTGLTFTFVDDKTVILSAAAQSDAVSLGPVVVEGAASAPAQAGLTAPPLVYAGGQVARGGKVGILGARDVMETPFSVTNYTEKTIKDKQARTLAKVLENDSAVRFTTSGGHITENYQIRGFSLYSSDLALNGMYGLAPDGHVAPEFLERVEVLRGPNALLNGMSPNGTVAGSINLVPKRAGDTPTTSFTGDFTSGSQTGGHVDLGRRFGTDDRFGIRVNGVYREGEGGVEGQTKERIIGTVAMDYRGDDLRLALDAYSMRAHFENGSSMMAQMNGSAVPDAPSSDTNLFKGTYADQDNDAFALRGEYDFTRDLTAYAGFGMADFSSQGFTNSTHASSVKADGSFTGQTTNRRGYTDSVSSETGLRSRFNIGDVGHELNFGLTNLYQTGGVSFVRSATYASSIYNPTTPIIAADPGDPYRNSETSLTSLAAADVMSFNDGAVQLTLGLRRQFVHSKAFNSGGTETSDYFQSAVTPALGVLVKPTDQVSLYANYIEALTKGSTVTNTSASNFGETFEPYVSKQAEMGVKWDAGKITNTLAVYQIRQRGLSNSGNLYVESEQRNRGVEWNVFGEVAEGFRLLGGASYSEGKVGKSALAAVIGKTPYGLPTWQGNLGAEWDPSYIPGLTLEGRAVYTGEQYVNSANTLSIPEWWRFDLGARFNAEIYGTDMTFRGYISNLLDHDYWVGSFNDGYATLSEPRTYMVSVTADF